MLRDFEDEAPYRANALYWGDDDRELAYASDEKLLGGLCELLTSIRSTLASSSASGKPSQRRRSACLVRRARRWVLRCTSLRMRTQALHPRFKAIGARTARPDLRAQVRQRQRGGGLRTGGPRERVRRPGRLRQGARGFGARACDPGAGVRPDDPEVAGTLTSLGNVYWYISTTSRRRATCTRARS